MGNLKKEAKSFFKEMLQGVCSLVLTLFLFVGITEAMKPSLMTVSVLLFFICYPIAYGMAKLFNKWANLITALIAVPLLISENIRLFGWVLVLLKNGILDGSLQAVERTDKPAFSFQGHPEASPGPHDVAPMFDRFFDLIAAYRGQQGVA